MPMLAQSKYNAFAPDDYRVVTQSFFAALAKKISD
jgi:hypothetical protein